MKKEMWINVSSVVLAVCLSRGLVTKDADLENSGHDLKLDHQLEEVLIKGLKKAPLFADSSPCQVIVASDRS